MKFQNQCVRDCADPRIDRVSCAMTRLRVICGSAGDLDRRLLPQPRGVRILTSYFAVGLLSASPRGRAAVGGPQCDSLTPASPTGRYPGGECTATAAALRHRHCLRGGRRPPGRRAAGEGGGALGPPLPNPITWKFADTRVDLNPRGSGEHEHTITPPRDAHARAGWSVSGRPFWRRHVLLIGQQRPSVDDGTRRSRYVWRGGVERARAADVGGAWQLRAAPPVG